MKRFGLFQLFGFTLLIPLLGMACATLMGDGSPLAFDLSSGPADGLTRFVDQNKYYQLDVPVDWNHVQMADGRHNHYYIDRFTSPDGKALIENITYDDGKAFKSAQLSKFALSLLNTFYSRTGKAGDIRIKGDSLLKDGRERLTWTSKSGGYSGLSFLDRRGDTTFLLLTVKWFDEAEPTYHDLLSKVVDSYRTP